MEFDEYLQDHYLEPAPAGYPSNIIKHVFGEGRPFTADEKGLEAFLNEHIPVRLTPEEADFFFRYYRDGESFVQIAIAQGVSVWAVVMGHARVLRKLRHPSFSKLLVKFFHPCREEQDGEEQP